MKQLLYITLFAFVGVFFTNCKKDRVEVDTANPEVGQEETVLYSVDIERQTAEVKALTLKDNSRGTGILEHRSQNSSANGHWSSASGATLSFSAVENGSGINGQSQFHGNVLLSAHFNTDCIVVVDNRAYFGGEITQWEVIEGGLPGALGACDVGWSIYFAVEDNGEGVQAEDDAVGQSFFVAPPEDPPACQDVYAVYEVYNIPFNPGVRPTNILVK